MVLRRQSASLSGFMPPRAWAGACTCIRTIPILIGAFVCVFARAPVHMHEYFGACMWVRVRVVCLRRAFTDAFICVCARVRIFRCDYLIRAYFLCHIHMFLMDSPVTFCLYGMPECHSVLCP